MEQYKKPNQDILPGYDDLTTDVGGVYYSYPGIATMQAYVSKKTPGVLEVEDIHVLDKYTRQGYGASLCLLAIEYARCHNIPKVALAIINPDALRLVSSLVGYENLQLYTVIDDPSSLLSQISLDDACARIEAGQKLFNRYAANNIDPPVDFDPGLYATFEVI